MFKCLIILFIVQVLCQGLLLPDKVYMSEANDTICKNSDVHYRILLRANISVQVKLDNEYKTISREMHDEIHTYGSADMLIGASANLVVIYPFSGKTNMIIINDTARVCLSSICNEMCFIVFEYFSNPCLHPYKGLFIVQQLQSPIYVITEHGSQVVFPNQTPIQIHNPIFSYNMIRPYPIHYVKLTNGTIKNDTNTDLCLVYACHDSPTCTLWS